MSWYPTNCLHSEWPFKDSLMLISFFILVLHYFLIHLGCRLSQVSKNVRILYILHVPCCKCVQLSGITPCWDESQTSLMMTLQSKDHQTLLFWKSAGQKQFASHCSQLSCTNLSCLWMTQSIRLQIATTCQTEILYGKLITTLHISIYCNTKLIETCKHCLNI